MIGHRKWFGAVRQVPGKVVLHGEKARFDAPVVVDEILYAELNSILGPKNDPKLLRQHLLRHCGEHLRITAKLDGVVRFGRAGKFGIPDLISSGTVQYEEVGKSSELLIRESRLINDRGL